MATSAIPTIVEAGNAKLIFEGGFTDLDDFNAIGAGYYSAIVQLDDGSRYPVCFYDPVRLQQDVAEEAKQGTPFVAEPGMIVLTEVSLENMKTAVSRLQHQGYFNRPRESDVAEHKRSPQTYRCHLAISRDDDGRFSAVVLNLPGAGSCGDSKAEAIANAREAVLGIIESYREDQLDIPWQDSSNYDVEPGVDEEWILLDA